MSAVGKCGYTGKVKFGIDPASNEFLSGDLYDLGFKDRFSNSEELPVAELGSLYRELIRKYSIVLLEDPFGQDDWDAWTDFNSKAHI